MLLTRSAKKIQVQRRQQIRCCMREQLGRVETNKRGVETTVKENKNEKQDVANDGATLSEDELLCIRWKNTGNLTTYLHNLATFLGNNPNLNAIDLSKSAAGNSNPQNPKIPY